MLTAQPTLSPTFRARTDADRDVHPCHDAPAGSIPDPNGCSHVNAAPDTDTDSSADLHARSDTNTDAGTTGYADAFHCAVDH